MLVIRLFLTAICVLIGVPRLAVAATDATLLRLFLDDGTTLVSFGEYARLGDRVVFSMPVGGTADNPRLYVVSVPAAKIDWPRTDRYTMSARYQWYAQTRGEDDFQRMSNEVARVLNDVALSTDRRQALAIAESARRTLAGWPATHFGYRQADVREIVGLLDEAISNLRASVGITEFALELVASTPDVPLEPLIGMPSGSEQLDQLFRVAALTERSSERIALFRAALSLLADENSGIPPNAAATLRETITRDILEETRIDERYAAMSRRLMSAATRAAAGARIADVERVLNQIPKEDKRLGGRRPEHVQALRASVKAQLDAARRLRLLKDRWTIRRALYREWQQSAGVLLLRLLKERPALEAIRSLEGPAPAPLTTLRRRLSGGANRLQRIGVNVPEDLRAANQLLVNAWQFAETAANARYAAVSAGNVSTAWEASSAAAAALLLLERVQQEVRTLLEPPRLR
jgi:hypothetical protein